MSHVITIFFSYSGMQPVNRVKVFLVVTCSLDVNVEECWRAQVSSDWLSGSELECRGTSMRERERQIKTHECCLDSTSLPTQWPVQGYDLSTVPLSTTTQQKCTSLPQSGCPMWGVFWPDRWRGLASCWLGGEFEGFFPQSVLLTICSGSVNAV